MQKNIAIDREIIRSFGRINGRKLRQQQTYLVENLLPKLAVDLSRSIPLGDKETWLEIGFGHGEHVVGMAQKYPDVNFIGCETFINGVATLLKHIDDTKVENIRILHGDARLLIDKLPDGVLGRVFILFPDPWPKTKQLKKRIINDENLEKLARVIKKGGRIEIATDHAEYGEWIASHLENTKLFCENDSVGAFTRPEDWVETRYQQKAKEQGREARFFNYIRN